MKRKVPDEAFPGTDAPCTVVIGPKRITTLINDRAVARKAASRTIKLVTVGRDKALALPGGQTTWWIARPWGGYLVRADVERTYPDMQRGWNRVGDAIAAVERWRKIADWTVSNPTAFLMILTSAGSRWTQASPPIPHASYKLDIGKTTIAALPFELIRFVRSGEVATEESSKPRVEPVPNVPKPMARLARTLRWVSTHGGPIFVVDRDLSLGWRGIFDDKGTDVFADGGDCDYNEVCGAPGPAFKIGRSSALLLETAAPTTWLADRNLILRSVACDDVSTVVAGAFEIPDAAWRRTRIKLTIGRSGARIIDATARGAQPRRKRQAHGCYEVLDFAVASGTYAVDKCEREGVYLLGSKRSTYAFEAYRLWLDSQR